MGCVISSGKVKATMMDGHGNDDSYRNIDGIRQPSVIKQIEVSSKQNIPPPQITPLTNDDGIKPFGQDDSEDVIYCYYCNDMKFPSKTAYHEHAIVSVVWFFQLSVCLMILIDLVFAQSSL